MTEEKLIEDVREFPCIWNTCSRSYKDQRARENAWKHVAQVVSFIYCKLVIIITIITL